MSPLRDRIFVDSNLLFSAALGGLVAEDLRQLRRLPGVGFVTSLYAWGEAERALENFRAGSAVGLVAVRTLVQTVDEPPRGWTCSVELADSDDLPIFGAAVAADSDFLVTGDRRHFGHLFGHQVEGVTIVDLTGLREALQAEREG